MGAERTDLCIPKLATTIGLWGRYLIGILSLQKTLTSGFLINLIKFYQSKSEQPFLLLDFDNFKFDNFTFDIDSSMMTRYGSQERAKKGYNPVKKGRSSHHPLIAFVNDVKLVTNMWLRRGDTSSANNFLSFLEDTLSKLKNKKMSLICLDSGFLQKDILDY